MSCQRFAGALIDHAAGGELAPALAAHLGGCADCREALATTKREMADLDGDLERMLAAEPSVEFAARVRQRIDREREAGAPGFEWRWAFGVAAAALITVAVAMSIRGRGVTPVPHEAPPPSQARVQPSPVPTPAPTPTLAVPVPEPRVAIARTPPRPNTTVEPARVIRAEPEVLVPPDQRLAIARFVAMSRAGTLSGEVPAEPAAEGPSLESPPVVPLVVDDLKVTPIAVDAAQPPGGPGGDQRPRPQAAERAGRLGVAN